MKEIVFEAHIPGTENLRATPVKNIARESIVIHRSSENKDLNGTPQKIVPDYLIIIEPKKI
jgi:hypothetical protein